MSEQGSRIRHYGSVQSYADCKGFVEVRRRMTVGMTGVRMPVMTLVRVPHRPSEAFDELRPDLMALKSLSRS